MVKGVLFDMDGVLFDTERPAALADALACQRMGYTMPQEVAMQLAGANAQATQRTVCAYFGPDFDYPRFRELVHEEYEQLLARQGGLALMDGVPEALNWLYGQGIPMCVASSTRTDTVERYLIQTRLRRYFTGVIGGDMVQRSKPAPDIFKTAAEALGLPPALCVAVEDSYNGVRSANAAGCITVMIPDVQPVTDEMYDLTDAVLDSMAALPGFIQLQQARRPN